MKQNSAQLLWRTINKNKTKNKWKILQLIHLGIILTSIKLWSLGCKSCHDCKMKRNSITKASFYFGVQPIQSPFAAQMHHIKCGQHVWQRQIHVCTWTLFSHCSQRGNKFCCALAITEQKSGSLSVNWQKYTNNSI